MALRNGQEKGLPRKILAKNRTKNPPNLKSAKIWLNRKDIPLSVKIDYLEKVRMNLIKKEKKLNTREVCLYKRGLDLNISGNLYPGNCSLEMKAKEWGKDLPCVSERVAEYRFVFNHLEFLPTRKILDIGVGPYPSLWYMLSVMRYEVTGTDTRDNYVGHTISDQSRIVLDDISKSCFPDSSFGGVLCISTLEHIENYFDSVVNMKRIACNAGIVIITVHYSHKLKEPVVVYDQSHIQGEVTRAFGSSTLSSWDFLGDRYLTSYLKCWSGDGWRRGDRYVYPRVVPMTHADLVCAAWRVSK